MGNAVEEGPDVDIEHPVLSPTPPTGHRQRVMGTAPRTIAIAVPMEDRLQRGLQQHRRRRLGDPVGRVRHTQNPDPGPMIFRYLHRPHRSREIASRAHPIPQLVEVIPLRRREPLDADRVHTRRPTVGPNLLPRPIDEAFVDLKRLHLRLRSHPRLLPHGIDSHRVDLKLAVDCPAPSLQPITRPSSLLRTGPPLCPASVLCHSRPSPLVVLPLVTGRPTSPIPGQHYRDDRFSCSLPAPATSSRHLYTGHHQGHTQAAPQLRAHPEKHAFVPDHPTRSGFDAIVVCFDASAVVHTRSSSRRTPAPLPAGLLPQRSPPRLLTDAACGGLGSPPARRTRRAPPPSLVQHASCWRSSTSSPLHFRTHVGCQNSAMAPDQRFKPLPRTR